MRIHSMTANFGKLENQTLTLQPGMNILHAPNEWGKSTWCAFLATMLYGLDTREKTTKTTLALKERYAPWSGTPMSGRIQLEWNGRNITIERWSKGRTLLGEFKAYETDSGLEVTELTGANCGEMLLGVEKSVFLRSGFLRLNDLPVTADDALRRRLNSLVTTGDESGAGDELEQKLRDLKNKCRSNRSNGLIPQAEAEKRDIESKLSDLISLQSQSAVIRQRQQQLDAQIAALENHKTALDYRAAEENLRRVAEAEEAARFAQRQVLILEEKSADFPPPEEAKQKLTTLQNLQQKQQAVRLDAQMLPPPPQEPKAPLCFYGLTGQQALEQVHTDTAAYHALSAPPAKSFPLWIPGTAVAVTGIVLLILQLWIPAGLLLAAGAGLWITHGLLAFKRSKETMERLAKQQAIASRYGGGLPEDWLAEARVLATGLQEYKTELEAHTARRQAILESMAQLDRQLEDAAEGMGISAATEFFSAAIRHYDALHDARREQHKALDHADTLRAVATPAVKPQHPDPLDLSPEETLRSLSDAAFEQKQLQLRLGQFQGRMDALGSETALRQALDNINRRLDRLTLYYNALELALNRLETATAQLQRRFAPRIAESAREIFGKLTEGRYNRLNLTQELAVETATDEDTAIRSAIWRSDGTIDQLYLALRLAVARELTPEAPLILDDALVRFDDTRHGLAMEILRQEAETKQIILFTCQSRERNT